MSTHLDNSLQLFSAMLDSKNTPVGKAAEGFDALLKNNRRIAGEVALNIYRNNSIGARLRALQLIYPVIEKILGERCFLQVANKFISMSPSLDSDLNNYGPGFPGFLAEDVMQRPGFNEYRYLSDLARLEWTYHSVYFAGDDEAMPERVPVGLTTVDEQAVHILLNRPLYLIQSIYPIYDIWKLHQAGGQVEEVAAIDNCEYLLARRNNEHPVIERINRDEWTILQAISVSQIVESVVELAVEKKIDVAQILPAMMEKGWVRTGFNYNEPVMI